MRRLARGLLIPVGGLLAVTGWYTAAGPTSPSGDGRAPSPWVLRFGLIDPPVVHQTDVTVRAPVSNRTGEAKPLECSGLAFLGGHLLLSSDRHGHVLFTSRLAADTLTIGSPIPRVIIPNEQYLLDDAECLTLRQDSQGQWFAYLLCSLSNDRAELPLPKRRHMVRVAVRPGQELAFGRARVLNATPLRTALQEHFRAVGIAPYRTYYVDFPGENKNTYRWGNVEGMTFTPDGSRLLCGMRNPLCEGRALLFTVTGVDDAFEARDAGRMRVTDLFALDLGNRGISDLAWDPVTQGYLITAAKSNGPKHSKDQPFPPNTLDSALLWWSGHKRDAPRLIASIPDMKIEAVCRLGTSRYIAVGSDEGDVSEDRRERQSVITILAFPRPAAATGGRP